MGNRIRWHWSTRVDLPQNQVCSKRKFFWVRKMHFCFEKSIFHKFGGFWKKTKIILGFSGKILVGTSPHLLRDKRKLFPLFRRKTIGELYIVVHGRKGVLHRDDLDIRNRKDIFIGIQHVFRYLAAELKNYLAFLHDAYIFLQKARFLGKLPIFPRKIELI